MSSLDKPRVTILGAGIIGLTTACTLLKEYSSHEHLRLTIIGEQFTPETTGDVSAGYWEPYGFDSLDDRILRWAGYTYDIFMSECFSSKAARAGVMKMPAYTLHGHDKMHQMKPEYSTLVRHFRTLDAHEMKIFVHLKPISGFVMSTVTVEVRCYLRELQQFLSRDPRVRFIPKKIHSFNELRDQTDLIIHCSGLAARQLANDLKVRPARGQIIRVVAPWIKSVYNFDTDEGEGYIIPQCHSVVLGGTFQLDDWNTSTVEADTKKILRMCSTCLPALKHVQHGSVQVGLRPYRDGGVRLEYEKTPEGMDVIHCYGHSGSGVTLSWGCAKDVVEIVKKLIPCNDQRLAFDTENIPEHEQLWRLVGMKKNKSLIRSKY